MANKKTTVSITIAKRIKFARKAKGLTQSALAEMIGVTDQVIRAYELGNVGVSKASAIAIATVLGCDMGYFLDESITEIRPLCSSVEAYKEIARCCFDNAKEGQKLREKVIDIFGDSGGMSLFDDVSYHCSEIIRVFTPSHIVENDDWWFEFNETDDFEKFWHKWYETTERSF